MKTQMISAAVVLAAVAGAASAQTVVDWNLSGALGTEASFAANSAAANITGGALARGAGLTGNTGTNSINAAGWNDLGANDYFSMSFSVNPGFQLDLSSLYIGSRSSGSGPGNLGLFYNGDGFTTNLFSFNQAPGGNFVNSVVDLSSLPALTGNLEFRVRALNGVAANGGAIASSGTFRLTAFFVNGLFDRNLQFTGTVSPVPTPGALALLGVGGLMAARRRRA
ncbi:MAG TPA: hypothetical protein DEB06_05695 [Phycisphaerales bacterium]|nr:hypothetical protein [Phycisphaerales bacterium]